jgi:hypothetical protein
MDPLYIPRHSPPKREIKFPKLYEPRPWACLGDQPGSDARWRNVPEGVDTIDISERLDLDRKAREEQHVQQARS